MQERIKIIKTPLGDAPQKIREAWIGTILPLAEGQAQGEPTLSWGVTTGKRANYEAYIVPSLVAFKILKEKNAEAEHWWKMNTPWMYRHASQLAFNAEACELVK